MGATSDGCTVRSGLSGRATELDGAGGAGAAVRAAASSGMCRPRDTLGGSEAGAAFDAFAAAWDADAAGRTGRW
ncbi:hypothetical protein [Streptomyces sp. NPDC018610]|uniref:hypothetical protein n=1 Tax=Streptomyces sp. NPDC018610 TaxID=3365049 RepID=UPI0037BC2C16